MGIMADPATPFEDQISKVQTWMENISSSNSDLSKERNWCTLDMTKSLTQDNLNDYFNRDSLGESYATEYVKTSDAGAPYAFIQTDSDLIFSLHKSFSLRHRPRLMNYRDDCAQKNYHTYSAISLGIAKYLKNKDNAERLK